MEEAAQLADRVAIMNGGKIIALDTPAALVRSLGAEDIVVFTTDTALEPALLDGLPGVGSVRVDGATVRLSVRAVAEALPPLFSAVAAAGRKVVSLSTHQATLEDVFVHHTGRGLEAT
jgi:ABC-2 type transport system ATP-binding protein